MLILAIALKMSRLTAFSAYSPASRWSACIIGSAKRYRATLRTTASLASTTTFSAKHDYPSNYLDDS